MPALRRSRHHSRGALRRDIAENDGQSAAARAATGFLLGLAAGAAAALVTPRREQRADLSRSRQETAPSVM